MPNQGSAEESHLIFRPLYAISPYHVALSTQNAISNAVPLNIEGHIPLLRNADSARLLAMEDETFYIESELLKQSDPLVPVS